MRWPFALVVLIACAGSSAPRSTPAPAPAPDAAPVEADAASLAACPARAVTLSNRRCALQPPCADGNVTCECAPECATPQGRPGIRIERINVWHCGGDRCAR